VTTTVNKPGTDDLARLAADVLRARRGELAQGLQGAALEGLPLDDEDARELAHLDAELRRRGLLP
jgi:predicted nucleic acid-binding protein